MGAMTSLASIPTGRPFTVDDLEAMPDDGNRYEVIDGMLIVTPAPGWHHQEMGLTAYLVLRRRAPVICASWQRRSRCGPRTTARCSPTSWSPATSTSRRRTCPSPRCS